MNSRQRILLALDHREPDRVPIDIGTADTFISADVYRELAALMGVPAAAADKATFADSYITPDEQVLRLLGADVRLVYVPCKPGVSVFGDAPAKAETLPDGTQQWAHPTGQVMRRPPGHCDVQLHRPAITGPLTGQEIERVFAPGARAADWADADAARREIDRQHEQGLAVQCNHIILPVTVTSNGPMDFTSWALELAAQPELVCRLMDRYLERALSAAESFYAAIGEHADVVYAIGDDVASHAAMWMSPADYRRYVKPRHRQIVEFVKRRAKAKVIHHCCGACRAIIGDLIEIGVDVLNPTQTSAAGMDPFELKRDFGKDITFWGGIDVMDLLRRGTEQQVRDAVKRHIDALAAGGGYVLSPSHIILSGTPARNVLAMYQTALSYG